MLFIDEKMYELMIKMYSEFSEKLDNLWQEVKKIIINIENIVDVLVYLNLMLKA